MAGPVSYQWEIYSSSGVLIADLGPLARNRQIKATRNGIEDISFDVDAAALNALANKLFTTNAAILGSGNNEIRVGRTNAAGYKTYLCGGRIDYHKSSVSAADKVISVTAHGFFSMLKDRFYEVARTFSATDYGTLLWTVVNETQTASANFYAAPLPLAADCDFGITQGTVQTIGNITITYDINKKVDDIVSEATKNNDLICDFSFSETKVFNVWQRLGSDKPTIIFEYPGGRILDSTEFDLDAQALANRVTVSGQNAAVIVEDAGSEATNKVRQYMLQSNSETSATVLTGQGKAYSSVAKNPLLLVAPEVDLNGSVTIDQFWIGDRITVRNNDSTIPVPAAGLWRVEALDLKIDENGMETAKLTLTQ